MIIMAIDGASRRNGKPDCLSTGSVFIYDTETQECSLSVVSERNSTNQRGEISALLTGLIHLIIADDNIDNPVLVTDSEYVHNTVSKQWYKSWARKGWITGSGTPVKNQDQWEEAAKHLNHLETIGCDLTSYHVKGHLLSIGVVTATSMIDRDKTGRLLYNAIEAKWKDFLVRGDADKLDHAKEVFERNHGFLPDMDVLGQLIICNTVADYAATYHADITDAEWKR